MPEVSVILPVFNAARTISAAVRSILDQTLRDIELIVVDDGSADETVRIVRQMRDPRLKLVECSHCGVAAAANTGTSIAVAPFIARMDADDVSRPHRLEKQLALLHQQQLNVAGCQVRIVSETGSNVQSLQRYERWINQETIDSEQMTALRFVEFPLVNPTLLASRRYFEIGFRSGDLPEDYDLMLRAAARGMRFEGNSV